MFHEVIKDCDYLIPQHTPKGYKYTYWTFTLLYERKDVSWEEFRNKFNEFGGDGIYAAWKLSYQEDIMTKEAYKKAHSWTIFISKYDFINQFKPIT